MGEWWQFSEGHFGKFWSETDLTHEHERVYAYKIHLISAIFSINPFFLIKMFMEFEGSIIPIKGYMLLLPMGVLSSSRGVIHGWGLRGREGL